MKKLEFRMENTKAGYADGVIYVNVYGYEICYDMQTKHDYTIGMIGGAATMREYIENERDYEESTHYLNLKDSDWKKVVHGYVPYEFYINEDEEMIMRFHFSIGDYYGRQTPSGEVDVLLGKIVLNDMELKLITDDGEEHIFVK